MSFSAAGGANTLPQIPYLDLSGHFEAGERELGENGMKVQEMKERYARDGIKYPSKSVAG